MNLKVRFTLFKKYNRNLFKVKIIFQNFNFYKANDLKIKIINSKENFKLNNDKIKFGSILSNHMFIVNHNKKNGWGIPSIEPTRSFTLIPSTSGLHYGIQVIFF